MVSILSILKLFTGCQNNVKILCSIFPFWLFSCVHLFGYGGGIMIYFDSRYQALKSFPNAIIRKLLKGNKKGHYVAFNAVCTHLEYKQGGYVI